MDCLFCKIVNQEISAQIRYEDDDIIAFDDISPQAPTHVLIVPKKHIATINDLAPEDNVLIGNMVTVAKNLAESSGIAQDGYRLVFNVNDGGGQAVYHIHLHLLGGRKMMWPPG